MAQFGPDGLADPARGAPDGEVFGHDHVFAAGLARHACVRRADEVDHGQGVDGQNGRHAMIVWDRNRPEHGGFQRGMENQTTFRHLAIVARCRRRLSSTPGS
ncbi:MAG: hypothetical protein R2851_10500 [Caldilineaceae bacterium]